MSEQQELHQTDRSIIAELSQDPRATITTLSRSLGVSRGTIQLRLERLQRDQVILGLGPALDPAKVGFGVVAFITLSIVQGRHDDMIEHLGAIAEVLEVHTITGGGDLLCRVAARSNDHLHEILQRMVTSPLVVRTETQLALSSPIRRSLASLVGQALS